jgi:adenosylcobinamide-GDP ribazoletransferase
MTDYTETVKSLIADMRTAISLSTRIPVGPTAPVAEGDIARASWALPVAGILVGLTGAIVYWLAIRLHLQPEPAAMLALGATILVTGAMHEDGLADAADGFGGGKTAEQKLEIMRDSRIGAFGACALIVSIVLRWSSLAAIADPRLVAIALIVAHAAARAPLPLLMRALPPARTDGLSAGAGPPPPQSVVIALALGIVCLLFGFGVSGTMTALVALVAAALALARVAKKQIGGQTGDVLGALEQVCEAAVLAIASSLL